MTDHSAASPGSSGVPDPAARVVFVGLGAIGRPMAAVLAGAGLDVGGVEPGEAARGLVAAHPVVADLAAASPADLVLVMVATADQLAAVVDAGLAADAVAGRTWVLMSTVGPEAAVEQAGRLRDGGARVVDAPVTGGVARARTGDLVLFAAGTPADLDPVRPVLDLLGTVRTVGEEVGAGQSVKLVNQHLASVHLVAAAEALGLARRLGLDPGETLDLVEPGAAGSWMLSDRGPRMLLDDDAPVTSSIGIFVKDSGLVADAARTSGAAVPLLDAARARYLAAAEAGLVDRDDSRVISTYQREGTP